MKKKSVLMNQRGVISFVLVWMIFIVSLLFLFTFVIPFLISFNTRMYSTSQVMFNDANKAAYDINDSTVRGEMVSIIASSKATITDQTANLNNYFQYSWILFLIIITLIVFLITRQSVEAGGAI